MSRSFGSDRARLYGSAPPSPSEAPNEPHHRGCRGRRRADARGPLLVRPGLRRAVRGPRSDRNEQRARLLPAWPREHPRRRPARGGVNDMSVRETTPIGVFRPKAGDEEFLSVTTAVKMLANEALATYGAQEVAKAAVRLAGSLPQRIHEEGPAEVARQLADKRYARSRKNRTGRQIGAEVHDGWHTYALHEAMEEVDDEINPYLVQLKRWHKRTGFRFLAAELTGFNLELGFAGTLDTLGELQDR